MSCTACGTENPVEARFCLACGAALTASGDLGVGLRVARLGDRLLAVILDTALLAAVFAVVGMWAAVRWGGVTPSGFEVTGAPALLTIGAVAVMGFLYYWLFEGLFGATIGKAITGITVCALGGGECGMKRSLIRNVLRLVDGFAVYLVGFLVAVFSKKRQRLGDHLAGTYVVERVVGGLWRVLLVVVWLVVIGAAIWSAVVIHRAAPTGVAIVSPPPTDSGRVATTASGATAPSPAPILASGDLKLSDLAFLQSTEGPSRPPGPFKPSERLFATFKVTGLTTDPQGQTHLQYGLEAFDANGVLLQKLTKELTGPAGAANTATISIWLDIPPFIPPGAGKVRLMAHDNVKNTDGEMVALFVVDAPAPVASSQLEIRDLQFSLSESGPTVDPAVISPGDTLYVQGKLAGMQFRGDQADVGIAFQVLDPEGSKVVDKPDFLELKDSFVYHPPTFYVPITAHLSLPPGATKGSYRERYVVRDRIGGATRTYELTFKLQ